MLKVIHNSANGFRSFVKTEPPDSGLNNSIGPIARNCPSGNRICGPKLPVKLLILKVRATQTFSVIKQPTLYALEFER